MLLQITLSWILKPLIHVKSQVLLFWNHHLLCLSTPQPRELTFQLRDAMSSTWNNISV